MCTDTSINIYTHTYLIIRAFLLRIYTGLEAEMSLLTSNWTTPTVTILYPGINAILHRTGSDFQTLQVIML